MQTVDASAVGPAYLVVPLDVLSVELSFSTEHELILVLPEVHYISYN